MANGLGNGLNKKLTKPPLPLKKGKPKIIIVKLSKGLQQRDDGLYLIEIDRAYAEISSSWVDKGYHLDRPAWLTAPDTKDVAIWFAQNPSNTIIIHQDIKYMLMQVAQGSRQDVPCNSPWCKKWALDTGDRCNGHHGAPPGFIRTHNKKWVLKPVVLPPESEAWVNKHLREVL